ncbi:hypothetical protein CRYUN_Cryun22dG0024000 [Craigia yunnanensis]
MEFQNSHFTYLNAIRDSETALYEALWHACAGPSVTVPRAGERVFYFPQGHLEQVEAFTNQVIDLPRCDLPSKILCRVINVQLKADQETDEVFAQVTLLPEIIQDENAAEMEPPVPSLPEFLVHSFCKTLTPSDTSLAFSVPKLYADQCLPPLDMSIQPPAQELVARDLQGNQWRFSHIYRGQPRRHLLTSGWKDFVSSKRLVAGDVFIFLRAEAGELCVGVRRSMKPQGNVSSSLISIPGMYLEVLVTAWKALARRTTFTVSYKPRTSPAEFIVPFDQYMKSVKNNYSIGMRFQMKVNWEWHSEQSGTIVGIEDADPVKWPGSLWRYLKVRWVKTCIITRPQRVSPWKIELALTYPILNPLPMLWPESNIMPLSTDSPVLTREGTAFSRVLQGQEFSNFGGNFAWFNESATAEKSVMQPPFIHDKKIDMVSSSRSNEPTNIQFLLSSGPIADSSYWCCCPLFVDQTLVTAIPMGKQVVDQEEKHTLLASPRSLMPPALPTQLADAFGRIFI